MAMTVPARTAAAGNVRRIPAPRRAPGWEDVRRAMITAAEACAAAVAEMCRAPADGRAADRAGSAVAVLRELGAQAGCLAFDDAVIEAERAAAVREFRAAVIAAGPCQYRRLRAVR